MADTDAEATNGCSAIGNGRAGFATWNRANSRLVIRGIGHQSKNAHFGVFRDRATTLVIEEKEAAIDFGAGHGPFGIANYGRFTF